MNDEDILVIYEEIKNAFPNMDTEIVWEVLMSYEINKNGIENTLNKLLELNGEQISEVVMPKKMSIDEFDELYDFKPSNSQSENAFQDVKNFASNIWTNLTAKRKFHNRSDEDESFEMRPFNKKEDQT